MEKANKEEIKKRLCPNNIINDGDISLGEFKTIQEAYEFPLPEIWCINRQNDNKFNAYKNQGTRIFIICSWNRNDNDALKYVLALVHANGIIHYWDRNDLPLYPEEKKHEFEGSLGDLITYTLYQFANQQINKQNINCNRIMNKNKIRLTESQLHKVINESVNKVLSESFNPHAFNGWYENSELKALYDAIDNVREKFLGELMWKSKNYDFYSSLYPRLEEIDKLLLKAVRLADPDYAVKYEHS